MVDEITRRHGDDAALGIVADVGASARDHGLVADVVERFGGLDLLVNNAGVAIISSAFQDRGRVRGRAGTARSPSTSPPTPT